MDKNSFLRSSLEGPSSTTELSFKMKQVRFTTDLLEILFSP